jgi:transposase-like protein
MKRPQCPKSISSVRVLERGNHRFPGEIISHEVWLYYRFPLSYRDVQELLLERGIDVTHEAIRQWCLKFGQDYANQLKHRRAQPGDKWHLDEVFLIHAAANFASFLAFRGLSINESTF